MGVRARATAALLVVMLVLAGSAAPASAAQPSPPPQQNPVTRWLRDLLNQPPRQAPARPPTAPARPPTAPARPPTAPPAPAPAPAPPPASGLPGGSGSGRRIVYCVGCQRVWLVEANEQVVKTHLVSGRAGVPRPGTYAVFSKSLNAVAGSRKATMTHMVRFARGRTLAIGFHAIPRDRSGRPIQTESQLGTYRSLGCVRQADPDAVALWNFAPIGTKVVVV